MKRIEIDSELNPFFDATERFLIKFRTGNDKNEFKEKYKHLNCIDDVDDMKMFVDYMVEVNMFTDFPYITVTEKDIIIKKFRDGLEYFENSVL